MDKAYVYGIVCPILKRIVYVGATVDLESRFKNHKSGNYRTKIGMYVKSLRCMNLKPDIVVLDECLITHRFHSMELGNKERRWIKRLSKKVELLNNVNYK